MRIETETDTPSGWSFGVLLLAPPTSEGVPDRTLTLQLSWADFEHWSGGAVPPSAVAQAVVELALDRKPAETALGDFDAAMLRRWFPGADEALQERFSRER